MLNWLAGWVDFTSLIPLEKLHELQVPFVFKDYRLLQSVSLFLRWNTFLLFRQWSNFTEIIAQEVQLVLFLRDNVGPMREKRDFFLSLVKYAKFIETNREHPGIKRIFISWHYKKKRTFRTKTKLFTPFSHLEMVPLIILEHRVFLRR